MLRDLFSLFPAHAGVILRLQLPLAQLVSFPRTCGVIPVRVHANPSVSVILRVFVLFPAHAGVILLFPA